jgi:hypothetical protein
MLGVSSILEQHMVDLRAVLERLREAGLVLNVKKRVFGVEEVNFLATRSLPKESGHCRTRWMESCST